LFQKSAGMAEQHVVSALRNKRAELAGMVGQLEQQLARQRTNLAHLDATMRLFDPDIRPQEIRAKRQGARSAWFRQGECLRRIHDELRDAAQPLTTWDVTERIMRAKAVPASDAVTVRTPRTSNASLRRKRRASLSLDTHRLHLVGR
jgi:hypothetical protein